MEPGFKPRPYGSSLVTQGLRIWWCHCSGSGYCCGMGPIPGLGISTYLGYHQKRKQKEEENPGHPGLKPTLCVAILCFFFLLSFFWGGGHFMAYGVPWLLGQGSDPSGSCSLRCSNIESLTHCVGLGIKPASQGSRVATNPTAPQQDLLLSFLLIFQHFSDECCSPFLR